MKPGPAPQTNDAERFWDGVARLDVSDCWPWMRARSGGRDGKTYGIFTRSRASIGRRCIYAHRMAWCLANEVAPADLPREVVIRHSCDNPICCNPQHLEQGSQADNVEDMVTRGRGLKGEQISTSVLTIEDVREIKRMLHEGLAQQVIANKFGVSRPTISLIKSGRNWGWVK